MLKPPALLELTLNCVMCLLGEPEKWDHAKKVMANPTAFLDRLKYFSPENLGQRAERKAMDRYVSRPDYHPDQVRHVSQMGAILCQWTRAVARYGEFARRSGPRRAKLAYAEEQYQKKLAEFKAEFGTAKPVSR